MVTQRVEGGGRRQIQSEYSQQQKEKRGKRGSILEAIVLAEELKVSGLVASQSQHTADGKNFTTRTVVHTL